MSSSTPPRSSPRRLGPYEIIGWIGSGGMAEVHLARRFGASGWEKTVALKLLRPEHRGHAELERLLLNEAKLGARFAHPGLVQVHDLGLADGVYYLCMDYVDGCDLAALLARAPLSEGLALLIGERLAQTLAYVHALTDDAGRPLGLVHRDVSPGNVLISRSGAIKLSDFGIAKATAMGDRTWGRIRKGKYAYMAPEQLSGEPLSAATDVFALGVTIHELLLRRRPFDGPRLRDFMEALRLAELAADHDFGALEPELAALLRRCLAKDPSARPDAASFAAQLQQARRRRAPVGILELAAWVQAKLEPGDASDASDEAATAFETLGMDDEG